jgi:hypothetical protein
MPCVHEFGIINNFDKQRDYSDYSLEKYNCISVDDDVINELYDSLLVMKSYFHRFDRPEFGLAYYGVTIIPPESLSLFYDVVLSSRFSKKNFELDELAAKIIHATEEKKYMIHFGI